MLTLSNMLVDFVKRGLVGLAIFCYWKRWIKEFVLKFVGKRNSIKMLTLAFGESTMSKEECL